MVMTLSFRFPHNQHWREIDLGMAPDVWAARETRRIWGAAGLASDRDRQQAIVAHLTMLAQGSHDTRPEASYVLCPTLGEPPAGVLDVVGGDCPDGFTRDDAIAEVTVEGDLAVSPPHISDIETRAGSALRVQQRQLTSLDPPRDVVEVIQYSWLMPDNKTLLLASIVFLDLVEAAKLAPMVDALARQCEIAVQNRTSAPS
jgi:hypothetical protein